MSWWMWLAAYFGGAILALLIASWLAWRSGERPMDEGWVYAGTVFWPAVVAAVLIVGPFVALFAGAFWITKPSVVRRRERKAKAADVAERDRERIARLEKEAGIS